MLAAGPPTTFNMIYCKCVTFIEERVQLLSHIIYVFDGSWGTVLHRAEVS